MAGVQSLPCQSIRWSGNAGVFFHAFPPHIAIIGERHVGENHVLVQAAHAVGVGVHVGAGGHAKVTGFGVDGVHLAVGMGFDPGDVVTDGGDFPAGKTGFGRHQHGEIGLAAGAGECSGHVVLFALGIGHAQDEHVLGQPALVAAHVGCNTQRKALLAQQRVAAVTGAVRPDFAGLGVMHDVLGLVARPLGRPGQRPEGRPRCARRAQIAVGAEHVVHSLAHAGHDLLVDGHVGAVRSVQCRCGQCAAQRAHGERHHVHGAASHAAVKQGLFAIFAGLQHGAHVGRGHPVVGGAGVFFLARNRYRCGLPRGPRRWGQSRPGRSWGAWRG
jgi:hypothetical protein